MNPFVPEQASCTFGCEGFLCDAADGCKPDLLCKNSVCTKPAETHPGTIGSDCNSKQPCLSHLTCEDSICQECAVRPSIPPPNPEMRRGPFTPVAVDGDPNEQCKLDTESPFLMRPWCLKPQPLNSPSRRGNPCHMAAHCDANEYCDWGICKVCTEGCLGMKCRSNNKCKTGFCNTFGYCDYMAKPKKLGGPGMGASANRRRGPGYNVGPKRQESGPNKVRDVPMRVNIPKDSVQATGGTVPT